MMFWSLSPKASLDSSVTASVCVCESVCVFWGGVNIPIFQWCQKLIENISGQSMVWGPSYRSPPFIILNNNKKGITIINSRKRRLDSKRQRGSLETDLGNYHRRFRRPPNK